MRREELLCSQTMSLMITIQLKIRLLPTVLLQDASYPDDIRELFRLKHERRSSSFPQTGKDRGKCLELARRNWSSCHTLLDIAI